MDTPITAPRLSSSFTRLAWSNLAAQSAEQIGLAAAPIVAVLALGAGAGETGLLQTAQTLPFLLLAIPAGLLVDRTSRRGVMASAEALRAAALIAVVALTSLGALNVPLLAVLGFIGACGTVAYNVSAPALVPALVPASALVAANGRIELARTVAFAGGPALAGTLVGWTGATSAFTLAAVVSASAVFLLAGLSEPPRAAATPHHALHELREGAAFVFRHPLLFPVLLTKIVFGASFLVLQAVYVPYAVHRLGLSAAGVGATLATYGIGMIAGALLAGRLTRRLPFGIVIAIGPVAGFAAALVMILTLWVPSGVLAGVSFLLMGAGPVIWIIVTGTLRQTVTPRHLLGRVAAIDITAYGARPLGAALGAFVGGVYGVEACIVVAAVGFLAQALIIIASPVLGLSRQPEMIGT